MLIFITHLITKFEQNNNGARDFIIRDFVMFQFKNAFPRKLRVMKIKAFPARVLGVNYYKGLFCS